YRVQQGQSRLQVLLRRAHGGTPAGDGAAELQERLRADTAAADAGAAAPMEEASDHLRQLDERLVPSGRAARLHSARFQCHAPGALAPVPSADKAIGAPVRSQL